MAAKRFEEHYGFCVERSWLQREVQEKAKLAEDYVAKILKEAEENAPNKVDQKSDQGFALEGRGQRAEGRRIVLLPYPFGYKPRLSRRPRVW
ncbi:hypothetical protein [Crocosphaera sp. Alani8]|uniref:hypothetical protein n=1 Tax=Crocosphaera sp. Alani8 TaxID=3038952 RepID=UPI00313E9872